MFAGLKKSRSHRLEGRLKDAKGMAEGFALKGFLTPTVLPVLLPILGQQGQITRFSNAWVGGTKLKHLPVPKRPRAVPYNDELPAEPIKSDVQKRVAKLLAGTALLISYYAANKSLKFEHIAPYKSFAGRRPVLDSFTGMQGVDMILGYMGSFFSYSVVHPGHEPFPRLQLIYLLTILIPVCSIWTIEASRRSNRLSPITL